MVRPAFRPALTTAVALAALAAAAGLTACEDRAYPSPAHEASEPAPTPTELAGAPTDAPPSPVEAAPPAEPPPPAAAPTSARGDSAVVYDLGPVVGPGVGSGVGSGVGPGVGPERRETAPPPPVAPIRRAEAYRPAAPAPPPRRGHSVHPSVAFALPVRSAPARAAATPAAPAHPTTSVRGKLAPAPEPQAVAPTTVKPVAAVAAGPAKPEHKGRHHGHAIAAAKTGNATDVGDHAAHLAALQTALRDAVLAKATLRAPSDLPAGRGADVTLTLPANFADTVRAAAQKEGLADAAASVNLTALLAGDGYAVQPEAAQSQPLTLGQPTEFHWTATANPGAKGALHAEVGAELLGGGAEKETLSLGAVRPSASASKLGPKLVGAGILGLIVVAVLAWLSRSRGLTPAQQASARRAAERSRNGFPVVRPLDMTPDGAPPPPPPRDAPQG